MDTEKIKSLADKAKKIFKDAAGTMTTDKRTRDKLEEGRAADRKAIQDVLEAASLDQRMRDKR